MPEAPTPTQAIAIMEQAADALKQQAQRIKDLEADRNNLRDILLRFTIADSTTSEVLTREGRPPKYVLKAFLSRQRLTDVRGGFDMRADVKEDKVSGLTTLTLSAVES